MKHSLYESWILEDVQLSEVQQQDLDAHLKECNECRRLADGWQNAAKMLHTSPEITVKPGFTRRFMDSLPERKARRQRSLARRLFWGLALSGGMTFLAAAIAFIAVKSPVALLVDFISGFLNLSTTISLVQSTLQRWLQISPLPLTIALSLVVISWISLISTAWVFTMWKINQQGVQS